MRASIASFWQEFKSFAFKGNMIDLAVAVVIGTAFSGVINSLVSDVIMPSISYVTTAAREAGQAVGDVAHNASQHVGLTSKPAETEPSTQPATQPAEASAPPPPPPPPPAQASSTPNTNAVDIDWKIGRINIGRFVGSLINFVLVAFAVFVTIVKLLGSVMKRVGSKPADTGPTTKECPYCLSLIPIKARKCANCTADLPPVEPPPGAPAASTGT